MPDVMPALRRREEVERGGDQRHHLIERAWACGPEEGFEFGERLFDGIEIGTVGWQETEMRADGFDRGAHLRLFVHGEVVEDDHIAGSECRDQDLLDRSAEAHRVDRAIEDGWGADPIDPSGRDHGLRFPMTARRVIVQACAARAPTGAAQQIGRHPALIQKHVAPRIVQRQPVPPLPPLERHVSAPLFRRRVRFFLTVRSS